MQPKSTHSRLVGIGVAALALLSVTALVAAGGHSQSRQAIVYKGPSCMCCTVWTDELAGQRFDLEVHETSDLSQVMSEHGVPPELESCHIALIDDYVVVGHVPLAVIERLLEEKPDIAGLAVPAAPESGAAPGEVLAFDRAGKVWVYSSH